MVGPRGGKIDWTDPEQVKAYRREYSRAHRDEINRYRRERRKQKRGDAKPAGDGTISVNLERRDGWWRKAHSTERIHEDDLTVGYDELERYRTIYRRTKEDE